MPIDSLINRPLGILRFYAAGTCARTSAQVHQRTISEQIEYWSKIGRIAEDNPDLTFTLVQEILAAELEPTVGE
jgi:hypothetical protein